MSFRKLRGVRLSEEKQGLIRYTCLNYASRPKWEQEKIRHLCDEHGGQHSRALFEVMTTKRSITAIALEHAVSESVLYRARKSFFENWREKRLTKN